EVQRVGLSAAATPLAEAAQFLAGAGRPCTVAQVADDSPLLLTLRPLEGDLTFVRELVALLEPELRANRATLIFTNARGLTERLAWALRRGRRGRERRCAVQPWGLRAGGGPRGGRAINGGGGACGAVSVIAWTW